MKLGGGQPRVRALCESAKRRPYKNSPSFGDGHLVDPGDRSAQSSPSPRDLRESALHGEETL